jgi:hypothetical protein
MGTIAFEVTIPQYLRKVKISEKRRSYHYTWNGLKIVGKNQKHLPKTLCNKEHTEWAEPKHLRRGLGLAAFKNNRVYAITKPGSNILQDLDVDFRTFARQNPKVKFFVVNRKTLKKVLSNPNTAGTPRFASINGQKVYSSAFTFERAKITKAIKEEFLPYVKNIKPLEKFPIMVEQHVYDTLDNELATGDRAYIWDLGNRAYFYGKCFLDLISTGCTGERNDQGELIQYFDPIIPDDSILYVTKDPQGGIFCPVETKEESKLVFVATYDDREIIKNNSIYQEFKYTSYNDNKPF